VFYQYLDTSVTQRETGDNLICCVQKILRYVPPVSFDERAINIKNRFLSDPELLCVPVLKNSQVCGLINRHRFMENHMVGRYGFGHNLNYYKPVEVLLEDYFLQIEQHTTIDHVAKLIQLRDRAHMYDDICVTDKDKYVGIISVSDVLSAISKNNLILAIGANPLSGLPGNDFIQRGIRDLLEKSASFDICYIDIDFFKPFNDRHGFAKGDEVIKAVADILVAELVKFAGDTLSFAGHIGGDDFIMVTTPEKSLAICREVIARFADNLPRFHGAEEALTGYYESVSRKGERERFPLLSLSIAVISTEVRKYSSFAEIFSIVSGLKKKAKQQPGSVIIRDRRVG
jgi:GGDEF domain-containing protein/predicted transcriptional regulator